MRVCGPPPVALRPRRVPTGSVAPLEVTIGAPNVAGMPSESDTSDESGDSAEDDGAAEWMERHACRGAVCREGDGTGDDDSGGENLLPAEARRQLAQRRELDLLRRARKREAQGASAAPGDAVRTESLGEQVDGSCEGSARHSHSGYGSCDGASRHSYSGYGSRPSRHATAASYRDAAVDNS